VENFYTEDAHLLPPNHPRVSGRSHIRRFFQGLREAGVGELSAETIQIDVSGDLAYCMGTYAFGTPAANKGKFLEVYRRQADGSWKMVADMFSGDQAAP
jgi:ketosteroid isomerase-like protein